MIQKHKKIFLKNGINTKNEKNIVFIERRIPMSSKMDWSNLAATVVLGVFLGALVGAGIGYSGLPGNLIAPVTGGLTAALIPLIYQLRTRSKMGKK